MLEGTKSASSPCVGFLVAAAIAEAEQGADTYAHGHGGVKSIASAQADFLSEEPCEEGAEEFSLLCSTPPHADDFAARTSAMAAKHHGDVRDDPPSRAVAADERRARLG
ncbi:MAG: hypothetical protein ACT4PV_01220 [Planctomycetaceae bacterium]